jgi:predicted sulfurtransferase/23S rRNA-/tRNA-specific pseudouridylate synthase
MASEQQQQQQQQQQHVILFYKYHPLSSDWNQVQVFRTCLETLCHALELKGRILVGCNPNQSEGINGTLSGNLPNVQAFVHALTHVPSSDDDDNNHKLPDIVPPYFHTFIIDFWRECRSFYQMAGCAATPLRMEETEFKWSSVDNVDDNDDHDTPTTTTSKQPSPLFPDLNIKIVKELIGTGGVMAKIPLEEIAQGYLTPAEWHARLQALVKDNQKATISSSDENNNESESDTILIDCRNTKEVQIGHFEGGGALLDPHTTTFHQFPKWVQEHSHTLARKKILMYCTGGIRCEKASAYIRRTVPSVQEVSHLKGGIHKYLDDYGQDPASLWKGKNFVFDGRGVCTGGIRSGDNSNNSGRAGVKVEGEAVGLSTTKATTTTTTTTTASSLKDLQPPPSQQQQQQQQNTTSSVIVGKCVYCLAPHDTFDPFCVCTVCREPTLVCLSCQDHLREFHCQTHSALKECYFTDLSPFPQDALQQQLHALQTLMIEIAIGRRYKQRRKTLQKQIDKICQRLQDMTKTTAVTTTNGGGDNNDNNSQHAANEQKCRNCGEGGCSGRCWGFHGLKRKYILEEQQQQQITQQTATANSTVRPSQKAKNLSTSNNDYNNNNNINAQRKELQRKQAVQELIHLQISQPPMTHRDATTGIRIPPPCTRVLETTTKGKWCGNAVLQVVQDEFQELSKIDVLQDILKRGLLRVNRQRIGSLQEAESLRLRNMDTISRVLHWHEPPVHIPNHGIPVQKMSLPKEVKTEYGIEDEENEEQALVYVCNKPSSVPVHPAGPYLANSLTLMVEAQENLAPRTLIPCHRIDRVTSGLTLCCSNAKVANLIQSRIAEGGVQKLYLAKIQGEFPASSLMEAALNKNDSAIAEWTWCGSEDEKSTVRVRAPIETVDPANGIRKITQTGKPATSLFRRVAYDSSTNTSVLLCRPLTGRSHQLRVHLQWLGFPIVNDFLYDFIGPIETSIPQEEGMKQLVQSIHHQTVNEERRSDSISEQDAQAARETCRCCQGGSEGVAASFTAAQLLQSGYSICLHAYRYQIPILPKKRKNKAAASSSINQEDTIIPTPIAVLECKVDLPEWAQEGTLDVARLDWLSDEEESES